MDVVTSDTVPPTPPDILAPPEMLALERRGDEIATLSAHLDAASARLLDCCATSTPAAAGTPASAPAPTGWPGARASTSAPPASASATPRTPRATSGTKAIHELKEDFGIDRISSSSFGANAADLELKILAFNLLVLYQRQALGWTILHRAKTVRRRLIAVAGQLIRTAGRWVLKLAADWAGRPDVLRVRTHLATLGP
jgi:hypothetical protein